MNWTKNYENNAGKRVLYEKNRNWDTKLAKTDQMNGQFLQINNKNGAKWLKLQQTSHQIQNSTR